MEALDKLALIVSIVSLVPNLLRERPPESDQGLKCLTEIETALKFFQNYIENDFKISSEREHIIDLIASYCLEPMFSKSIGKQLKVCVIKWFS